MSFIDNFACVCFLIVIILRNSKNVDAEVPQELSGRTARRLDRSIGNRERQDSILRKESTLSQKPSAVWIFESVYRVTQYRGVLLIEQRVLVVALSRGSSIGHQFIEVGVAEAAKHRELTGSVEAGVVRCSSAISVNGASVMRK